MAKDPKQDQIPALDEEHEILGPPKSYRLQIALGLVGLILFQMIVLWLLLPSRDKVQTVVGVNPVDSISVFGSPDTMPPDIVQRDKLSERQIGDATSFKLRVLRETGVSDNIEMNIFVKIRTADEMKFDTEYPKVMNTMIASATKVIHGAPVNDFIEAGNTALGEKIKRELNRTLSSPWVVDVYVLGLKYDPGV